MKVLSGLWAVAIAVLLLTQPDMAFAQSGEGDSDPGGGEPQTEPSDRPDETDNGDPDVPDSDDGSGWSGDSGEPEPSGEVVDDSDGPGSGSGGGTTATSSEESNDWDDSEAGEILVPTWDGDENYEATEVGR